MRPLLASLCALTPLLFASFALAQDSPSASAWDIGLRTGLIDSPTSFIAAGAALGLEGHYHVRPWLRIGGYLQGASLSSTSSDSASYGDKWSAFRFGPRVELHSSPNRWIDPFFAFALGGFSASRRESLDRGGLGLDTELNVGADFRLASHFSIAPVFALVIPVTNRSAVRGLEDGLNLSYSGHSPVPLPMLRAQVVF